MKQPIYTVTAKLLHEEALPIDGTSQTFMVYSEALTYFHDLCIRNGIIPQKWVQSPLEITASSTDHKIQLQILNF
jgi:hypothetical protein